ARRGHLRGDRNLMAGAERERKEAHLVCPRHRSSPQRREPVKWRDGQATRPVHDPHLGVAIEGAGTAETEHLLASFRLPGGSRTAKGWPRRLGSHRATLLLYALRTAGVDVERL